MPNAHGQGAEPLEVPRLGIFCRICSKGRARPSLHDEAFLSTLISLLRAQGHWHATSCPIIPDEARTFGIDALVSGDRNLFVQRPDLRAGGQEVALAYYHEAKDGQILEEGITEAGSMASFVAAGTAYANYGVNMIPFYIYYSMFGPQRVGDEIWLAGDSRAKGFLLGATSGRTTLNGEGLQHQDGHSPLMASTVPTLYVYDPAFAYETRGDHLRRHEADVRGRRGDFLLPLPLQRKLSHAADAGWSGRGDHQGTLQISRPGRKGRSTRRKFSAAAASSSRPCARSDILAERYDVSADVWSATSYKSLRNEALLAERWNLLHPMETQKKPYIQTILEKETGPFIAVSDYMKMVPDQISKWVPGGLTTLGTDGFGRSDIRSRLRRFFEIDAECVVVATLSSLAQKGEIDRKVVAQAIKDLKIDPEKGFAQIVAF